MHTSYTQQTSVLFLSINSKIFHSIVVKVFLLRWVGFPNKNTKNKKKIHKFVKVIDVKSNKNSGLKEGHRA